MLDVTSLPNIAKLLKEGAKRWVRPFLIPVVRPCIRYAPHERVRRIVWRHLVGPFFQFADKPFVVTTIFGAAISGNTKDFIQRRIYYFGVWEPNLTAFLSARLREGDVFVDVGANIGYFTLLASKAVGRSGKVIAIEASPMIFSKLVDNLKRNRAANVEAINVAASDREGMAKVFCSSDFNIGESTIFQKEGSSYECDVSAKPLDSLIPPIHMANLRFVKIDVEGAEWLVIAGMREVLRRARPDVEIVVEVRPESLREHGKSVEEVFAMFADFGFFPYRIENNYDILSYMPLKDIKRPLRIRSPISTQTDVIFSRADADWL